MAVQSTRPLAVADHYEFVRGLFGAQVARGELELPVLPEIAARVVSLAGSPEADAAQLARLITGDQALAAHVMKVATSASYQPRTPIESLQHAISWLGMAEVSDIAFTVAVQGKLLNVPGQKQRVLRMWKNAVATALWARSVADSTTRAGEACYLNGLLHEIGKPVCLQAVSELSRRAAAPLIESELDALVAEFQVDVGAQLAALWKLPPGVGGVIRWWSRWADAPGHRDAAAIVYLAHRLAEQMLEGMGTVGADELARDPVVEHLGLGLADVLALCAQGDHVHALVEGY